MMALATPSDSDPQKTGDVEPFGELPDGTQVDRIRLRGGGLTANVLTWGVVLQDLRLDGHPSPLVLGYDRLEDHLEKSPAFGQTCGRVANRIAGSRLEVDGTEHRLERNEGANHLHGGANGLGRRVWRIERVQEHAAVLSIGDPDGHAGYPGSCRISAEVALLDPGVLRLVYRSTTDAPTVVNLTHHSYFTLDDRHDTLDTELEIDAEHYLPTRPDQIPTGELAPVDGTPFDFRTARPIRQDVNGQQVRYDHHWCLSRQREPLRPVALARSPHSGVELEVATTEPGLQFYSAFKLEPTRPGLDGRDFGPFAGFCLETQAWPDAPHHEHFPSIVLRPGEELVQETEYRFRKR